MNYGENVKKILYVVAVIVKKKLRLHLQNRHAGTYRDMVICTDNFLADALTLNPTKGADYAHQLDLDTSRFVQTMFIELPVRLHKYKCQTVILKLIFSHCFKLFVLSNLSV